MNNTSERRARRRLPAADPAEVRDNESRRMELADLAGTLNNAAPAGATRVSRRRRNYTYVEFRQVRKKQRVILIAAAIVLFVGTYWLLFAFATKPEEPLVEMELDVQRPEISQQELESIHALSRKLESKAPNDQTALQAAPLPEANLKAEREALLRRLTHNGIAPEYVHPTQIKLTAGKPVTCYCVLTAPLEPDIEAAWEKAGLLARENEIISPFLRYVVIENEEAIKQLVSSRVESVVFELDALTSN